MRILIPLICFQTVASPYFYLLRKTAVFCLFVCFCLFCFLFFLFFVVVVVFCFCYFFFCYIFFCLFVCLFSYSRIRVSAFTLCLVEIWQIYIDRSTSTKKKYRILRFKNPLHFTVLPQNTLNTLTPSFQLTITRFQM